MNDSGSGLHHPTSAAQVDEDLVAEYFRHLAPEDRQERTPEQLRERVADHVEMGRKRPAQTPLVEVVPGESSTVVYVVTDDMPFLVDSVTFEVLRHARALGVVLHPTFVAARDADTAELTSLTPVPVNGKEVADTTALPALGALNAPAGSQPRLESWISVEIGQRLDEEEARALREGLLNVLTDVRLAVEDWPDMRAKAHEIAKEAASGSLPVPEKEAREAAALLDWLDEGNFTFLGYREYRLGEGEESDQLIPVDGSSLGLLRNAPAAPRTLTGAALELARKPHLLVLTTANRRSTVHHNVYLDYVGIKTYGADGQVTGERRFVGLYSTSALRAPVMTVPVVRSKVKEVLARAGFLPDSHTGKDLLAILESLPREELMHTDTEALFDTVMGIQHLQERRRTRVFFRVDAYGRFVSVLVFIPRDRFTTAVRLRVEEELRNTFGAESLDYSTHMSGSALVRLYYRIRLREADEPVNVDRGELEARLARAVRSWSEGVTQAYADQVGSGQGREAAANWGEAFPADYRVRFEVEDAIADAARFESLQDEDADGIALTLSPDSGDAVSDDVAGPGVPARLRLYLAEEQPLSNILPVLHAMGIDVREEHPYVVKPADGRSFFLDDLAVNLPAGTDLGAIEPLLEEAYRAVLRGKAESDALQGLITAEGLGWRKVAMLRAYVRYLRQLGISTVPSFAASTLMRYPAAAAALVGLFEASFDPAIDDADREAAVQAQHDALAKALEEVGTLDADRFIRRMQAAISATLRTNYYQGHDRLAFKIATRDLEDAPLPKPMFEIWVYSPMVEGVHLRFGEVARGGLRWSDRAEDFRTEILGLVKAQTVKNAVIVPTGAKGGFYAKQLPDPAKDRGAWMDAGKAAYSEFIRSLLDVTDNLEIAADGTETVEPPKDVVRRDGDDTYLVVAADKGTASFSDLANSLAAERHFWLGDAFASGGSVGYDHKAMGITARGAWESVKRHFFELGTDVQTEDFTMVGIGDMSGDVFGNGLLRSEHAKLVAAFDHRHVFVDPDPDPAASFAERKRLFELPRSSWDDYDRSLISAGGGVFPRDAKSVDITPEMRSALGLGEDVDALSPLDLIQAVLKAPVDLLYNGGVGTYVKGSAESDAQVGDRANDPIRIDGRDLQVKVVGEGGNLGFTQLGRIEAAQGGVLINTDAIDNSAGVDTSDHEVNIKIIVDRLVRSGHLAEGERADVLASMTDEIAHLVLEDNFDQNVLLVNEKQNPAQWGASQERLMTFLQEHADLDRRLEFLPSTQELKDRLDHGEGLTTPELAVIVAYAKIQLAGALVDSALPDDPALGQVLTDYFPAPLRERFGDELAEHPLRREIIATAIANDMVNLGGASYAFRAMEETNSDEEGVARAFLVVRRIYEFHQFYDAINALPASFDTAEWARLHKDLRRMLDRLTRWFIEHEGPRESIAETIERFEEPAQQLIADLPDYLVGQDRQRYDEWLQLALERGVPQEMAERWARQFETYTVLDIVRLAQDLDADLQKVARTYYAVYDRFRVDTLLDRITALPRTNRWETLARAAMRDDLYSTVADLVASILREAPEGASPQEAVESWEASHAEAIERGWQTLREVLSETDSDMASLSVALRLLRSIVRR